jgi:hypothetical protein
VSSPDKTFAQPDRPAVATPCLAHQIMKAQ